MLGPGAWSVRCKMFKDESGSEVGWLGDRTVDPPVRPTVRWALAGSLGKPVVSSSDLASPGKKSKSRSDSSSSWRGFRMASAKLFPRRWSTGGALAELSGVVFGGSVVFGFSGARV